MPFVYARSNGVSKKVGMTWLTVPLLREMRVLTKKSQIKGRKRQSGHAAECSVETWDWIEFLPDTTFASRQNNNAIWGLRSRPGHGYSDYYLVTDLLHANCKVQAVKRMMMMVMLLLLLLLLVVLFVKLVAVTWVFRLVSMDWIVPRHHISADRSTIMIIGALVADPRLNKHTVNMSWLTWLLGKGEEKRHDKTWLRVAPTQKKDGWVDERGTRWEEEVE